MYQRNTSGSIVGPRPITPDDLLAFRTAHDLSQQQLADMVRIDRKTLSRWECGGRTPPPYFRLVLLYLEGELLQ